MNVIKGIGLLILAAGAFVFLSPFLTTSVNPDVTLGFLGLLILLLGGLIIASNSFRSRVRLRGAGFLLAVAGWSILSAGLLIAFAGFLWESQVSCSCPASGTCLCGVPLYEMMFSGGILSALVGAASIVVGTLLSRNRPVGTPTLDQNMGVRKKGITALAIALTVVVVFGVFSYWPGVYVTSINQETQFLGGMPSDFRGVMTSPVTQAASGFQVPVGGTFVYILHFNSVPSYPTYTIGKISMGEGFAIANMNASLPLVISPSNPSVSLTFTVRGPYYPYYGPVSFLTTIQK